MNGPEEQVLAGGNVGARVVRVGSTVRKPVTAATPAVEALLEYLESVGFSDGLALAITHDPAGRVEPDCLVADQLAQRLLERVERCGSHLLFPLAAHSSIVARRGKTA